MMIKTLKWIHLALWTLALAAPRRVAQILLWVGIGAALVASFVAIGQPGVLMGTVNGVSQRAVSDPVAARIVPIDAHVKQVADRLTDLMWSAIPETASAKTKTPSRSVASRLARLPAQVGGSLLGHGPHWVIATGENVTQTGREAVFIADSAAGRGARALELAGLPDISDLSDLAQVTPDPVLLGLACVLLALPRIVAALGLGLSSGFVVGFVAWNGVALADISGNLIAPATISTLLAGMVASMFAALGLRVGLSVPRGIEARLMASVLTLLAVPALDPGLPRLSGGLLLLAPLAFWQPATLASVSAAIVLAQVLQPQGLAAMATIIGCLLTPVVFKAVLTPPEQFRRPVRAWARLVMPGSSTEPRPTAVCPHGSFDWTSLLGKP